MTPPPGVPPRPQDESDYAIDTIPAAPLTAFRRTVAPTVRYLVPVIVDLACLFTTLYACSTGLLPSDWLKYVLSALVAGNLALRTQGRGSTPATGGGVIAAFVVSFAHLLVRRNPW